MRDVALELSPLIAEGNIDFSIETEDCPVAAHEWMLRELTRNLLHNALRHMDAGGSLAVQVRTQRREDPRDGPGGGALALLEVRDSGPGIDDELARRLFQPFAAGNARSGSGLGLAICQEIVQTLNGQILWRNLSGGHGAVAGLLISVELPLWQPRAS